MTSRASLCIAALLFCLKNSQAFLSPRRYSRDSRSGGRFASLGMTCSDDVVEPLPSLPASGETLSHKVPIPIETDETTSFVAPKFELQYTCKVCETRNTHRVSRLAYRHGVVIAMCKGCQSRHLIADNLGWLDHKGGFEGDINDIEDFFASKGDEEAVNRVSSDVFDLESLLDVSESGSIVGEDGELQME